MTVEVVNDQNRVVVLDDGNIVVTQGGNTVEISDVGAQGPAGVGADGYVLQAYDSTDQVAASTTVAYPVRLGTVDISDGITVANNGSSEPTRITFANDGNYDVQFSIQFVNTSASEANVNVWFRKNETDLADSNSQITVPKKHGSADGAIIMALNLIVNAASGDYVEIMWQTQSTSVSLQQLPGGTTPTTPATPSVIVTATVVRYLEVGPAGPGVAAGGTTGQVLTKASATDYDTTWATPALVFIKAQAVGSGVSTVTVTDAFPSGYTTFEIHLDNIVGSVTFQSVARIQLGAIATQYYGGYWGRNYLLGSVENVTNNGSVCVIGRLFNGPGNLIRLTINNPNVATTTGWNGNWSEGGEGGFLYGIQLSNSTATTFTITPSAGTMTGGTIRVYGYRNS